MFFAPSHNERLLRLLARDLKGWPTQHINERLCVKLNSGQPVIITSRKQRLFMAAIYKSQFKLEGITTLYDPLRITAHQPGWIRRYPVSFQVQHAQKGQPVMLINFLNSFATLRQTLAELDYRRFYLHLEKGRWSCEIEPLGASEVVCHLPPVRRYLRLLPQQRMLLLSVLSMLNEAMDRFNDLKSAQ